MATPTLLDRGAYVAQETSRGIGEGFRGAIFNTLIIGAMGAGLAFGGLGGALLLGVGGLAAVATGAAKTLFSGIKNTFGMAFSGEPEKAVGNLIKTGAAIAAATWAGMSLFGVVGLGGLAALPSVLPVLAVAMGVPALVSGAVNMLGSIFKNHDGASDIAANREELQSRRINLHEREHGVYANVGQLGGIASGTGIAVHAQKHLPGMQAVAQLGV